MARAPLTNVRHFTLSQLAELWYRELHLQEEMVLYELRAGVIGIYRLEEGQQLPAEMIPEDDLPPTNYRVDRDWIIRFCQKQRWPHPIFLNPEPITAAPVGRPTMRDVVIAEFQKRSAEGLSEGTISAEARAIHNALMDANAGSDIPQPKTIQSHIRRLFNGTVDLLAAPPLPDQPTD